MIDVEPSTAGTPASCTIGKLPEYHATIRIRVNGKDIDLPKFAVVNGTLQSEYYEIAQNDVIEINNYYTVEQLKKFLELENSGMRLAVNHMPADEQTRVYENFSVEWGEAAADVYAGEAEGESWLTDAERAERGLVARKEEDEDAYSSVSYAGTSQRTGTGTAAWQSVNAMQVSAGSASEGERAATAQAESGTAANTEAQAFDGQGAETSNAGAQTFDAQGTGTANAGAQTPLGQGADTTQSKAASAGANAETKIVTVMVNGDPVVMKGKKNYIFVDVFDYIDFDLSTPHGSSVVTKRNGENAGYVDVLAEGDSLEIYWEK